MQRFERLCYGSVFVPTMNLIEVDVISAETAQARVDFDHDGLAGQPACISTRDRRIEHLSGEHHLFAPREVAERASDNLFTGAVRVAIGRVEEVDAEFDCSPNKGAAFFLIEGPRVRATLRHAVGHTAEAKTGHFETALSKVDVIHSVILLPSCRDSASIGEVRMLDSTNFDPQISKQSCDFCLSGDIRSLPLVVLYKSQF